MTRSERRLGTMLLAICLLGGTFVAWDYYSKKISALKIERDAFDQDWLTIETYFEEREMWNSRSTWLEVNQPTFEETTEIEQSLYQEALAADNDRIETSNLDLRPTVVEANYTQSSVTLVAKGTLEDVFRWLHSLTRPEDFRVIRNMKVTPDKEVEGKIMCQFELLRWYKNKDT